MIFKIEYPLNPNGDSEFEFNSVPELESFIHSWNDAEGDYCRIVIDDLDKPEKLEFSLTWRDDGLILMTGNAGDKEFCAKNSNNPKDLIEIEEGDIPKYFFWTTDELLAEIRLSISHRELSRQTWVPVSELTDYFI